MSLTALKGKKIKKKLRVRTRTGLAGVPTNKGFDFIVNTSFFELFVDFCMIKNCIWNGSNN